MLLSLPREANVAFRAINSVYRECLDGSKSLKVIVPQWSDRAQRVKWDRRCCRGTSSLSGRPVGGRLKLRGDRVASETRA